MLSIAPYIYENVPSRAGSVYMDQLMNLYQRYVYEHQVNKLLAVKINQLNTVIHQYVEDREKSSFALFCVENYNEAITNLETLKIKAEFFLAAMSVITKTSTDRNLRGLANKSIEVVQGFVIKLIEFQGVYQELQNYAGEINEDSPEYKNKMAEIAEYISTSTNRKFSNTIDDLLAI